MCRWKHPCIQARPLASCCQHPPTVADRQWQPIQDTGCCHLTSSVSSPHSTHEHMAEWQRYSPACLCSAHLSFCTGHWRRRLFCPRPTTQICQEVIAQPLMQVLPSLGLELYGDTLSGQARQQLQGLQAGAVIGSVTKRSDNISAASYMLLHIWHPKHMESIAERPHWCVVVHLKCTAFAAVSATLCCKPSQL